MPRVKKIAFKNLKFVQIPTSRLAFSLPLQLSVIKIATLILLLTDLKNPNVRTDLLKKTPIQSKYFGL